MLNNKFISKKKIYLLILFIIPLIIYSIKPTYSKFTQSITTENIVNLNTNLTLELNNIEEYKTITIGSNDYEIFDIKVTNNTENNLYYIIWYQILDENATTQNITVSKTNSTDTTEGELTPKESITITLLARNNTNNYTKVAIGISTSEDSKDSVTYESTKTPITTEDYESNIYYDEITDTYYLSKTNTEVTIKTDATTFNYSATYQSFTPTYSGYYQIGLWAPATTTQSGDYLGTQIYLKRNETVYFYIGRNRASGIYSESDLRLISGSWDSETSLNSRILIAGNDLNETYTYEDEITNDNLYKINIENYDLKSLKETVKTSNINESDGIATISFIQDQEPTIEGINYVKYGNNYNIEDIKCIDNGRGCQLVKVRPETTNNLEVGTYEIVYIVKDNDNITYKYTKTFEVIS